MPGSDDPPINAIEVGYRYIHGRDVVVREVSGPGFQSETEEFEPAELHATLTDIHEAADEHERRVGRVERIVLGVEEFEQVLALAVVQRDRTDGVQPLGTPERRFTDGDPREVVEELVGADVVVVPGSTIDAVGRPIEELHRHLMEDADA